MKKIVLTTYIIGDKEIELGEVPKNVEILKYTNTTDINEAKGKYISFIDSHDSISDKYFSTILDEIDKSKFDICYINYEINYNYKRKPKLRVPKDGIVNLIPIYNPYIWNYVFKKKLIPKFKDFSIKLEDLKVTSYIPEILYFHDTNRLSSRVLNMPTRRITVHYKNIIYMEGGCNGLFNGYITWLLEIGKAFPKFDITIMYTEIYEPTLKRFSKYFKCVKYNPNINYTCDNLITPYTCYFFPNNIYSLVENSIFIHGNMSDYEHSAVFTDDIYDRYIAVSKIAMEKAIGYFPTDNIEYIYNPYTFDKNSVKPHLKLVSALRNAPEKGMERIKQMAALLDEENIPYTWSVFTDRLEQNQGGLIFRNGIPNVIDYIADSDYLVQLSRTESLGYSLMEALCANTKLITTDFPAVYELDVVKGKSAFVIPFEYFEEENKHLLREMVLEIYRKKDTKIRYKYSKSKFSGYNNVFSK